VADGLGRLRRLVYGFRRRAMRALWVDSELSACSSSNPTVDTA
jgi:hypothetical protein